MNSFKIGNFTVEEDGQVFIIAEAGVNHNGNIDLAKKLCKVAKESGADAVKFQTWETDNIIVPTVSTAEYQKDSTKETNQYNMLKNLEISLDGFREIADYCKKIGIIFLSTPGDVKSAKFLNELDIPAFKIGSDDLDNFLLLKTVAEMKKPMIISTGMATMSEILKTQEFLQNINNRIAFMHCTSSYPTKIEEANLRSIVSMKNKLKSIIGYSDHTMNVWVPIIVTGLGARIIEKHLTLDKTMVGPDHKISLNPQEFSNMVNLIRKLEKKMITTELDDEELIKITTKILGNNIDKQIRIALGDSEKKPTSSEFQIMKFVKKTIVATKPIKAGEKLSYDNISVKRAGLVKIKPNEYFNIINKIVKKGIEKNEVIDYEKCA